MNGLMPTLTKPRGPDDGGVSSGGGRSVLAMPSRLQLRCPIMTKGTHEGCLVGGFHNLRRGDGSPLLLWSASMTSPDPLPSVPPRRCFRCKKNERPRGSAMCFECQYPAFAASPLKENE